MTGLDHFGRRGALIGFRFDSGLSRLGATGQVLESRDDFEAQPQAQAPAGSWASAPQEGASLLAAPDLAAVRAGRAALRRGMRGDAVSWVQRALREYGARDDGVFGSGTESAVRRFQEDRGIKSDGVVGKGTMAAIDGRAPPVRDKPKAPSPSAPPPSLEYAPPPVPPAEPPVARRPTSWAAWALGAGALGLGGLGVWSWVRG